MYILETLVRDLLPNVSHIHVHVCTCTRTTDNWLITEIRPFGDVPCPRRRVGCALVGSDLFICGGTSPIEVTRDGQKKEILHDHNDVYILHLG